MLKKIISGGQIGADQAGLHVAKMFNLETGGWAPKKYMTKDGPNHDLRLLYDLKEHVGGYKERTWENVKESDGTIRFAFTFKSPGEICTLNAINHFKKPYVDVNFTDPIPHFKVVSWLINNKIEVLNIAGNARKNIFKLVSEYLQIALTKYFEIFEDGSLHIKK